MRITNLLIENFQIHKELLLEFTPGVNALVGESDAGKSAVVRSLELLLRNQPKGGEGIYQSDFTEKPLKVILEDDRGNLIERESKVYKVNGSPLKAYGSLVPEQVTELFPMKDINFQFQLDPYFLILETGGRAAEILNKATGFNDQELILTEIKKRSSESRRLLKTLIKQKEKTGAEIEKLKSVPHLLMKAKAILSLEKELEENISEMATLEMYSADLEEAAHELEKYTNLDFYKKEIEKICGDDFKVDDALKNRNEIRSKWMRSVELEKEIKKYTKLPNYFKEINNILRMVSDHNEIRLGRQELFAKKNDLDTLNRKWMHYEMEIDGLKLKLTTTLEKLDTCPLCGSQLKKGKPCQKHS